MSKQTLLPVGRNRMHSSMNTAIESWKSTSNNR